VAQSVSLRLRRRRKPGRRWTCAGAQGRPAALQGARDRSPPAARIAFGTSVGQGVAQSVQRRASDGPHIGAGRRSRRAARWPPGARWSAWTKP